MRNPPSVLRPVLIASALMVLLSNPAAARAVSATDALVVETPAGTGEIARGGAGDRNRPFSDGKDKRGR